MAKHTKCILFSESYGGTQNELATSRTLATIPFGGRYRLIDFILSSLVNANITDIGILTKEHYGSLSDHIGYGKDWGLDRRDAGLKILTPFAKEESALTRNRSAVDALLSAKGYIKKGEENYIILADTNQVLSLDFKAMIKSHKKSGADITILYREVSEPSNGLVIECDEADRVTDAKFGATGKMMLNVAIFNKELLLDLLDKAYTHGWTDLIRDFITQNIGTLNVHGFEHKGYSAVIKTVADYYKASMDLIKTEIRKELFYSDAPVLTRVKNSIPTTYGFDSKVKNSLIADGCEINGELNNCIVFRGVKIKKGAVLNNCIIMQHTEIGENARLNCVITDKDVVVEDNHILSGYETYPFVISKGKTV